MALLRVLPVDGVDGAVGAVFKIDGEVLFVVGVEGVLAVAAAEVGGVAA